MDYNTKDVSHNKDLNINNLHHNDKFIKYYQYFKSDHFHFLNFNFTNFKVIKYLINFKNLHCFFVIHYHFFIFYYYPNQL